METNFRTTNPVLHYGIIVFIYAVAALTLVSHTVAHALEGHSHSTAAACASAPRHTYTLTFTKTGVTPSTLTMSECDKVTVVNKSGEELTAAIGPHSHHLHYAGFTETPLQNGQTYAFRATETGHFPIHDHDNDALTGTLVVK